MRELAARTSTCTRSRTSPAAASPATSRACFPHDCDAVVHRGRWEEPRIFAEIQARGRRRRRRDGARVQPRPRHARGRGRRRRRTGRSTRCAPQATTPGSSARSSTAAVGSVSPTEIAALGRLPDGDTGRCYSAHTATIPRAPRRIGHVSTARSPCPWTAPRTRRTAHPSEVARHVPREPEDRDPLGARREDLGHPHARWSPAVPGERDPPVPRAGRGAPTEAARQRPTLGPGVERRARRPAGAVALERAMVAGTGVDPVTPRFSGACSAN